MNTSKIGNKIKNRFLSISRGQSLSFDCGNIDNFRGYDTIKVSLSIRDKKEQRYEGEVEFIDDRDWKQIVLKESEG